MPKFTHRQALSHHIRRTPPPDCDGELEYYGSGVGGDVNWTIYTCKSCGKRVYMVDNSVHWWNFDRPAEEAQ